MKNNNLVVVEPSMPTYLLDDVQVVKVVKFVFDPVSSSCDMLVTQSISGICLMTGNDNRTQFSALPLYPDTVADYVVYEFFATVDYDFNATIRDFEAWGITKVYLAPFYNQAIPMLNFLDGVLKHFVTKDKNYLAASPKEKKDIFNFSPNK